MLDVVFHCECPAFAALLAQEKPFFESALQQAFTALALPKNDYAVSVVLMNDASIQELNRDFRHQDKPTNVLSFPQIDSVADLVSGDIPVELGDIFLAYETIAREAAEQNKTLRDHTTHLLIHGLLHLAGYDHQSDDEAAQMEAMEIDVLRSLGIKNPY